uniref:Uncharacterized protein n=1 Tax=Melopsittacus undulatus TaxID=13146 RepID=A0A8V5GH63_MELUD
MFCLSSLYINWEVEAAVILPHLTALQPLLNPSPFLLNYLQALHGIDSLPEFPSCRGSAVPWLLFDAPPDTVALSQYIPFPMLRAQVQTEGVDFWGRGLAVYCCMNAGDSLYLYK